MTARKVECADCGRRLAETLSGQLRKHNRPDTTRTCAASGDYAGIWLCVDCDEPMRFEWYMAYNSVWTEAKLPEEAMCCIGCLEARLGRTLWTADFIHAPVNNPMPYQPDGHLSWSSARLQNRMCRQSVDGPLEADTDVCYCGHARTHHVGQHGVSTFCDLDLLGCYCQGFIQEEVRDDPHV